MTNRIFKASIIAAAVGAAFGLSAPASAITGIKFSADGVSASVSAYKFNWGIEQFMLQGANAGPTQSDFENGCTPIIGTDTCISSFTAGGFFYGQGRLNTVEDFPGVEVLNAVSGAGAISYQFKIPVSVTYSYVYDIGDNAWSGNNISGSISNVVAADSLRFGADNYFRIFFNSDGDETNQTAGTGYGTSEEANASQTTIFEGKVRIQGAGSNNLSTTDPFIKIGTTGTTSQGGVDIFSASGGGSATLLIEHCAGTETVPGPGPQGPASPCVNGATTLNTNFFLSDLEGLQFDVTMLPGYQALFGDTPVPARIVAAQVPNFGSDGTNLQNSQSCEISAATTGSDVTSSAFLGCDMIFRGTNSNAQFNGSFAPEPGSLALLGLGLGVLGFSARRRLGRKS